MPRTTTLLRSAVWACRMRTAGPRSWPGLARGLSSRGGDGAASVFIDIIGRPLTPRSFAGAARRGAWYAGAAAAAPYYRDPCGRYPYPPCY